jgi:hypothetical protein
LRPRKAQIPGVPDEKTCRDALVKSKAPASTQRVIPELGFERSADLFEIFGTGLGRQGIREGLSKRLEPTHDVPWQGRGPRDECDRVDSKSPALEACRVVAGSGEIPRYPSLAVDAAFAQRCDQRRTNLLHAAVSSELSDEPAIRLQRRVDGANDLIGSLHRVQSRVAEDGVELV